MQRFEEKEVGAVLLAWISVSVSSRSEDIYEGEDKKDVMDGSNVEDVRRRGDVEFTKVTVVTVEHILGNRGELLGVTVVEPAASDSLRTVLVQSSELNLEDIGV